MKRPSAFRGVVCGVLIAAALIFAYKSHNKSQAGKVYPTGLEAWLTDTNNPEWADIARRVRIVRTANGKYQPQWWDNERTNWICVYVGDGSFNFLSMAQLKLQMDLGTKRAVNLAIKAAFK